MATTATCPVLGQPDMYGLGIRVAYYIQWFGVVIMEYLDEAALADIRLLGLLLSSASSLSLIIQLSINPNVLQPVDIYIVLLLATGMYLFLVPLWIWRGFICCRPYWDPFKWSRESQSPIFKASNFTLLLAVASLQVWFWAGYAAVETWDCRQYGFFFSPVWLGNKGLVTTNAFLYLVILVVCCGVLLAKTGWQVEIWKDRRRRRISKIHMLAIQELRTFSNLVVASILVAAVELTVVWNNIPVQNVNTIQSAAQTIPLVVSAGLVVRVVFLYFATGSRYEDDEDSESESSGPRSSRRSHRTGSRSHSHSQAQRSGGWPSTR